MAAPTTVAPASAEEAAAALGDLGSAGEPVRIAGAGTKRAWSGAADGAAEIGTSGLNRILEHNAGDLTAVLEAGVPLAEAQAAFAESGQMLAIDPPLGAGDAATIGGVVATADAGPLRHRFGTIRDLVIGITVALTDGSASKSGGKVIKNVAGYDMAKLFAGSHGSLGMVTTVTVRLHPHPLGAATAVGRTRDRDELATAAVAATALPLEAECLDVHWEDGEGELMVRFAGATAGERATVAAGELRRLGLGDSSAIEDDEADDEVWAAQRARQRSERGTVMKVSALPADLGRVLAAADAHGGRAVSRAGAGITYLAFEGDSDPSATIDTVRRALAPRSCTVLDRPADAGAEPWPEADPVAARVMAELKRRLDPAGVLPPGPGGCVDGRVADSLGRRAPPPLDLIDDCVHCGFCLPACPSYAVFGEEMDSPRGRIVLMRIGHEEGATLNPDIGTHFDRCLGCMACVTACPSGVQYDRLLERTRPQLERALPRSPMQRLKRRAVFATFTHPGRLRVLAPLLALNARLGISAALARIVPAGRLRTFLRLAPQVEASAATAKLPRVTPAEGQRRGRIAFMQGCVQRVLFGDVNAATVRVLAAEGWEVHVAPRPRCCGALQLHSGIEDEATGLAKRTIAAFEDYDHVVANVAGCGSAMKDYGDLLADDGAWRERAESFSAKVLDVHELLAAHEARAPRGEVRVRAAYHDACHLAHAQGVRSEPRMLLDAIPGWRSPSPASGSSAAGPPASTT